MSAYTSNMLYHQIVTWKKQVLLVAEFFFFFSFFLFFVKKSRVLIDLVIKRYFWNIDIWRTFEILTFDVLLKYWHLTYFWNIDIWRTFEISTFHVLRHYKRALFERKKCSGKVFWVFCRCKTELYVLKFFALCFS